MTDALPVESPHRRHELVRRVANLRLRHPVLMAGPFLIAGLLPLLLYLVVPALTLRSSGELTSASLELVAPDQPSRDALAKLVDQATPTEVRQIGRLAFVLDPYPFPLPVEDIGAASEHALPFAENAARADRYRTFLRTLRDARCVGTDGKVEAGGAADGELLDRARDELVPLQAGGAGIGKARYHYHMALMQLCRGDDNEAENQFAQAVESARAARSDADAARFAQQFEFLGVAGRRLVLARMRRGGELPALPSPDWPGGPYCAEARFAPGCSPIMWPARRTDLVKVHGFLADPAPASAYFEPAFDSVVASARSGDELSARAYVNAMLGHLKRGDYDAFGSLASNAATLARLKGPDSCAPLGRLGNAGWIAGRLDGETYTFGCPGTDGGSGDGGGTLPTDQGLADGNRSDFAMLEAWGRVHEDRRDLKNADFAAIERRARATLDNSKPVENDFVKRARDDLMRRVADFLLGRVNRLRDMQGGSDTETAVLKLLRSDAFPFTTRWSAASALNWKMLAPLSPRAVLFVILGLTAISAALAWMLWHTLPAYALLFTRRHHDRRMRDAKGAKPGRVV